MYFLTKLFTARLRTAGKFSKGIWLLPSLWPSRKVFSSSSDWVIIPQPVILLGEVCLTGLACSQACHADFKQKEQSRERKQIFSCVVNSFFITVAVKICSFPPPALKPRHYIWRMVSDIIIRSLALGLP